jgi:ribosomal protein L11 methyltransferase
MDWVELHIPHGPASDALEVAGEVRGDDLVIWVPGADAEREAAKLRALGFPVRIEPGLPEAEWRDAWKRWFKITRLGRRLVIVPSWERYTPAADDVVLDLDPGRAFGTGAHATTRQCLLELERIPRARRFLDLGTGSGILAIAAAKLWPEAAGVAWDADPEAVEAARENLERNGVAGRVALAPPSGVFDMVVANIQADVLEGLRDELIGWAADPPGTLILAGILDEQGAGVAARFALPVERMESLDGWTTIVLRAAR